MKIKVVFTCFNRKEKTLKCVERLIEGNKSVNFKFVVVDDGSTDGTADALNSGDYASALKVLKTAGNFYYSRGMNYGMQYILKEEETADYLLMVNDDVEFFENSIEELIKQSKDRNEAVIVGVTCDEKRQQTYGAIRYNGGFSVKYHMVLHGENTECDTFNANCVLIPYHLFKKTGAIDDYYIHSLGDFDYGLSLKRNGAHIYSSEGYVGICNRNSIKNTWLDKSLSLKKRIKLKESAKGSPTKQWFYFLNKNFGLLKAVTFTMTPYIKLLIGH